MSEQTPHVRTGICNDVADAAKAANLLEDFNVEAVNASVSDANRKVIKLENRGNYKDESRVEHFNTKSKDSHNHNENSLKRKETELEDRIERRHAKRNSIRKETKANMDVSSQEKTEDDKTPADTFMSAKIPRTLEDVSVLGGSSNELYGNDSVTNLRDLELLKGIFEEKMKQSNDETNKKLADLQKDLHSIKTLHGSTLTELNRTKVVLARTNEELAEAQQEIMSLRINNSLHTLFLDMLVNGQVAEIQAGRHQGRKESEKEGRTERRGEENE